MNRQLLNYPHLPLSALVKTVPLDKVVCFYIFVICYPQENAVLIGGKVGILTTISTLSTIFRKIIHKLHMIYVINLIVILKNY